MKLFTDRELGPRPRTETAIDRRVERAIAALIRGLLTNEAFGANFPSMCPDGAGVGGTDMEAFEAALLGAVEEMDGWIGLAIAPGKEPQALVPTGVILDTLEWLAAQVGDPKKGYWHDYYRHHHLTWFALNNSQAPDFAC